MDDIVNALKGCFENHPSKKVLGDACAGEIAVLLYELALYRLGKMPEGTAEERTQWALNRFVSGTSKASAILDVLKDVLERASDLDLRKFRCPCGAHVITDHPTLCTCPQCGSRTSGMPS